MKYVPQNKRMNYGIVFFFLRKTIDLLSGKKFCHQKLQEDRV